MDDETPHWEINNNNYNKTKSKYLTQYVGKNCYISLNAGVYFPSLDSFATKKVNATIEGYDDYFLHIAYTVKKKKYKGIIDITNVIGIVIEEEG